MAVEAATQGWIYVSNTRAYPVLVDMLVRGPASRQQQHWSGPVAIDTSIWTALSLACSC